MKRYSNLNPLIFGSIMAVIGLIVQQYVIVVLFSLIPIVISLFLIFLDKDKKRFSGQSMDIKSSTVPITPSITYKKGNYIFNADPQKYAHCRDFVADLTELLKLDSEYNVYYRYIAVNKENEFYEIHTKVIGFEGGYTHTKAVEDFANPPRKITISEFLELADNAYPSIRHLYEGINESNWELYSRVLDCWRNIPEDKKPIQESDIDKTRVRYEFTQSREAYYKWLREKSHIYPVVAISEFLFTKGFRFIDANVGGGINEISHTGDVAYSVEYTDFEDFRDNFDADLKKAEVEAQEEYSGWGVSLNYGYIAAHLEKEGIWVSALVAERIVTITWKGLTEQYINLTNETNRQMVHLLGDEVKITREQFLK